MDTQRRTWSEDGAEVFVLPPKISATSLGSCSSVGSSWTDRSDDLAKDTSQMYTLDIGPAEETELAPKGRLLSIKHALKTRMILNQSKNALIAFNASQAQVSCTAITTIAEELLGISKSGCCLASKALKVIFDIGGENLWDKIDGSLRSRCRIRLIQICEDVNSAPNLLDTAMACLKDCVMWDLQRIKGISGGLLPSFNFEKREQVTRSSDLSDFDELAMILNDVRGLCTAVRNTPRGAFAYSLLHKVFNGVIAVPALPRVHIEDATILKELLDLTSACNHGQTIDAAWAVEAYIRFLRLPGWDHHASAADREKLCLLLVKQAGDRFTESPAAQECAIVHLRLLVLLPSWCDVIRTMHSQHDYRSVVLDLAVAARRVRSIRRKKHVYETLLSFLKFDLYTNAFTFAERNEILGDILIQYRMHPEGYRRLLFELLVLPQWRQYSLTMAPLSAPSPSTITKRCSMRCAYFNLGSQKRDAVELTPGKRNNGQPAAREAYELDIAKTMQVLVHLPVPSVWYTGWRSGEDGTHDDVDNDKSIRFALTLQVAEGAHE